MPETPEAKHPVKVTLKVETAHYSAVRVKWHSWTIDRKNPPAGVINLPGYLMAEAIGSIMVALENERYADAKMMLLEDSERYTIIVERDDNA